MPNITTEYLRQQILRTSKKLGSITTKITIIIQNSFKGELLGKSFICNCLQRNGEILRMSEEALLELIADWFAANQAYLGKWPIPGYFFHKISNLIIRKWTWLQRNFSQLKMHPLDKLLLQGYLSLLGFEEDIGALDWEKTKEKLSHTDQELRKRFAVLSDMYNSKQNS
jgi:hypothetical protein